MQFNSDKINTVIRYEIAFFNKNLDPMKYFIEGKLVKSENLPKEGENKGENQENGNNEVSNQENQEENKEEENPDNNNVVQNKQGENKPISSNSVSNVVSNKSSKDNVVEHNKKMSMKKRSSLLNRQEINYEEFIPDIVAAGNNNRKNYILGSPVKLEGNLTKTDANIKEKRPSLFLRDQENAIEFDSSPKPQRKSIVFNNVDTHKQVFNRDRQRTNTIFGGSPQIMDARGRSETRRTTLNNMIYSPNPLRRQNYVDGSFSPFKTTKIVLETRTIPRKFRKASIKEQYDDFEEISLGSRENKSKKNTLKSRNNQDKRNSIRSIFNQQYINEEYKKSSRLDDLDDSKTSEEQSVEHDIISIHSINSKGDNKDNLNKEFGIDFKTINKEASISYSPTGRGERFDSNSLNIESNNTPKTQTVDMRERRRSTKKDSGVYEPMSRLFDQASSNPMTSLQKSSFLDVILKNQKKYQSYNVDEESEQRSSKKDSPIQVQSKEGYVSSSLALKNSPTEIIYNNHASGEHFFNESEPLDSFKKGKNEQNHAETPNQIDIKTNFSGTQKEMNKDSISRLSSIKNLNVDKIITSEEKKPEDEELDVHTYKGVTIPDYEGLKLEERFTYDKRGFFEYIKDAITNENKIFSIFFKKSLFYPTYLRVIRSFTFISFMITLNAIMYSDKLIKERYNLDTTPKVRVIYLFLRLLSAKN